MKNEQLIYERLRNKLPELNAKSDAGILASLLMMFNIGRLNIHKVAYLCEMREDDIIIFINEKRRWIDVERNEANARLEREQNKREYEALKKRNSAKEKIKRDEQLLSWKILAEKGNDSLRPKPIVKPKFEQNHRFIVDIKGNVVDLKIKRKYKLKEPKQRERKKHSKPVKVIIEKPLLRVHPSSVIHDVLFVVKKSNECEYSIPRYYRQGITTGFINLRNEDTMEGGMDNFIELKEDDRFNE